MEYTLKSFDEKLHTIYLKGEVNEDMWSDLIEKISEIKKSDNEIIEQNKKSLTSIIKNYEFSIYSILEKPNINIYLSTYGGSIYDMFSIYDTIKNLTSEYIVNIYCIGKVMSAGTIIMLSVPLENRFAFQNTTFMYHTLSTGVEGKIKDIEEDTNESKRLHKLMWNIYKNNTKIPQNMLDNIYKCKKDFYITSEQAKNYKIISKIVK